jgi:hypothetical protein
MSASNDKTRTEKTAKKAGDAAQAAAPGAGLETLMQTCGANLSGCVEAGGNVLSCLATMNGEMFEFLARRFQADVEASKALSQCRDIEEYRRLQTEYFSRAASDYLEQGRKFMEMTAKIAQQSVVAFRS